MLNLRVLNFRKNEKFGAVCPSLCHRTEASFVEMEQNGDPQAQGASVCGSRHGTEYGAGLSQS